MLGDTAIEWGMWAAEIAYGTYAGSPRTELMRKAIVNPTFDILKLHYDPSIDWDEYWKVVVDRIKELQAKEFSQLSDIQKSTAYAKSQPYEMTIEQLFGTAEENSTT